MKKAIYFLIILMLFWTVWANTNFFTSLPEIDGKIGLIENVSATPLDSISRNVVGIQPYMFTSDYLSEERFLEKLDLYFSAALDAGFFTKNTIVLLPEYLGTWLVILNEKPTIAKASSLTWAMAQLVLSDPIQFVRNYALSKHEEDRIAATLFKMKAEKMAETYQTTFLTLSKKYEVFISAGSINLPEIEIIKNQILIKKESPIYNTSFLFTPDGNIHPQIVKKAFPINSEKPFITASTPSDIPVFDLPMAKVGILVCADSWYPESYEAIKGVELVLVNSYCAVDGAMEIPWAGYNGAPTPSDVDHSDVGKISENEAWQKYALPGRISLSGAKHGVNIFLRGELWDLGTDGQPFFVHHGNLVPIQSTDLGGIWNMDY